MLPPPARSEIEAGGPSRPHGAVPWFVTSITRRIDPPAPWPDTLTATSGGAQGGASAVDCTGVGGGAVTGGADDGVAVGPAGDSVGALDAGGDVKTPVDEVGGGTVGDEHAATTPKLAIATANADLTLTVAAYESRPASCRSSAVSRIPRPPSDLPRSPADRPSRSTMRHPGSPDRFLDAASTSAT